MARRAGTLNLAAGAAAAGVGLLTLVPLAAVAWRAGGLPALGPADWAVLRFTLWQAVLSATLSAGLAVPVARALARRRFSGRGLIITLLGAPFLLPVIVAILGLVAIFGRAGLMNAGLSALGLPTVSVYGLGGVVLAHVFLNLPLATRLILQGWLSIPSERFRLAESLGMGPAEVRRFLEAPMLAAVMPGAWLAIFLVCLTSFAVALVLGGGPGATTLEVAIYQAFRFEFDLGRAAALALMQAALCLAAVTVAGRAASRPGPGAGLDRAGARVPAGGIWRRAVDTLAIGLATAFLLAPLAAVVVSGLPNVAGLPPAVWAAAGRSLAMALAATGLALALALPLALAAARAEERGTGWGAIAMLPLAVSPMVVGTGLFLLLRGLAPPAVLALPVTVAVNAAMALPFAFHALLPAARTLTADFGRLADSLGMAGLARLRLLTLPRLRRPLGFSAGIAAAFAMGDLGVVALFGDPDRATLPLQLYRLMGAYRMEAAAGAAVLLMALTLGLFWIFDRGGRADA